MLQKVDSEATIAKEMLASSQSNSVQAKSTGAIDTLKFFAWLDLVAGIFGSIWIWNQFGTSSSGIAIGVGVLLQGVFAWAYFLVIASMAENLIEIRKNTDSKKK